MHTNGQCRRLITLRTIKTKQQKITKPKKCQIKNGQKPQKFWPTTLTEAAALAPN